MTHEYKQPLPMNEYVRGYFSLLEIDGEVSVNVEGHIASAIDQRVRTWVMRRQVYDVIRND